MSHVQDQNIHISTAPIRKQTAAYLELLKAINNARKERKGAKK